MDKDEYESNQDNWQSIPGCVGTIYSPDPNVAGCFVVNADPNDVRSHRVFVCNPPKRKRPRGDETDQLIPLYNPPLSKHLKQFDSRVYWNSSLCNHSSSLSSSPPPEFDDIDDELLVTISDMPISELDIADIQQEESDSRMPSWPNTDMFESNIEPLKFEEMPMSQEQEGLRLDTDPKQQTITSSSSCPVSEGLTTPIITQLNEPTVAIKNKPRRVLPKNTSGAIAECFALPVIKHQAAQLYHKLSPEQKRIHNVVVQENISVFFTGSAGTGKTVLLRAITRSLQAAHSFKQVAVTASTGVAAVNISGVTLHRFAHLGGNEKISLHDHFAKFNKRPNYKAEMKAVKYLIIDEISMIEAKTLDMVDMTCKVVRENPLPFGGITVVFCGDFLQLPPVCRDGLPRLAFEAHCWNQAVKKTFVLRENFRQKDSDLIAVLNKIRVGQVDDSVKKLILSLNRAPPTQHGITATHLYSKNDYAEAQNLAVLNNLPADLHTFEAEDVGDETLLKGCMAHKLLQLKVGAQVMLIKNLSSTLINGSIGVVEDYKNGNNEELPTVRFNNGEIRSLKREKWTLETNGTIIYSRTQVPLILAWALSIHKSQGQTIELLKVDLGSVFEKGQAYVALSRARTMEGLQVVNFNSNVIKADPKVIQFYNRIQ